MRWQPDVDASRDHLRRWRDRLQGQWLPPRGAVSLEFDDGYLSAYEAGLPLVEARGWSATTYAVTGSPSPGMERGESPLMGATELIDWARRGEVGSHTRTHRDLSQLDPEALEDELAGSRADLEAVLDRRVHLCAAPFGSTNDRAAAAARRVFGHLRLLGGTVNLVGRTDPCAVRSIGIRRRTTQEEITHHLRAARRRRAWVVLVWHRIGEDSGSDWDLPVAAFRAQLDLVRGSGLDVLPTSAALRLVTGSPAATSVRPDRT